MGIKALIVMPITTPENKVRAVRDLGADTALVGDGFDQAYAHAMQVQNEHGFVYIPPFDDEYVMAGQGTIGAEILNQCPDDIEAIFVPVGGGGLIGGIGAYVKTFRPSTKIIGVEPQDAASMTAALREQNRTTLPEVGLFADGVADMGFEFKVGDKAFERINRCLDLPRHFVEGIG